MENLKPSLNKSELDADGDGNGLHFKTSTGIEAVAVFQKTLAICLTRVGDEATKDVNSAMPKNKTHPSKNGESYATTFKVDDKILRKCSRAKTPKNHIATYLDAYNERNCTEVIAGTDFSTPVGTNRVQPADGNNGFVNTIIKAFRGHHNLVLRPDDVWLAIIAQFSLYINANAEKFRRQFVNFKGKKALEVVVLNGTIFDTSSYEVFVTCMTNLIDKNLVDKDVKDWVLPNSTTTMDDKIAAGTMLMATLKSYFEYSGRMCICGIPEITILGTQDDWKNVASRLDKLKSYELQEWVEMLETILDQFIRAKRGFVDVEFWQQICQYETAKSGYAPRTYVSGWVSVFTAFDKSGKWQGNFKPSGQDWPKILIDSIAPGVLEVDVKIHNRGVVGGKYDAVIFAGHMAKEILDDGTTLQPRIGWAVAKVATVEEDFTSMKRTLALLPEHSSAEKKGRKAAAVVVIDLADDI